MMRHFPGRELRRHMRGGPLAWRGAALLLTLAAALREITAPAIPPGDPGAGGPPPPSAAGPAATPVATPAVEDGAATSERPLFSPTRRPGKPPPGAAPVPAALPPSSASLAGYTLIGITSHHGRRIGLLKSPGGTVAGLSIGQTVEGWTLRDIARGRLRFEAGGDSCELTFPTGKTAIR